MKRVTFQHLPAAVAGPLRAYYRQKRAKQLARVAVATAVAHAVLALAAMHADRLWFLTGATRVGMFWAVWAVTGLVALAGLGWFWWRRPTLRQVVYELEGRLPADVEERYVTLESVLASGQPVAPDLLDRLQQSVVAHARTLTPTRLARDRVLRRWVIVAGALVVGIALLFVPRGYQFPLMVARFYQPAKPLPKPSFIQIEIRPEKIVVGKGDEVVVQARITGRVPWLLRKLGVSADRCLLNGEPMSRVQRDLFLYSRSELEDSFSFVVRCGDAETPPQAVRVVPPPRILDAALTITPPAYVKQPATTITELERPVALLAGTKARLTFHCDQPVESRTIPVEWDAATLTGAYEFTVKEKLVFEVVVANREGFVNRERLRIAIQLREDARPVVTLDEPTGDVERVSGELLPVRATVTDDFGVEEVVLRYWVNPDPDAETPPTEIPLPAEFDLAQTGAVPGDVVALQVRARDGAGNDGFSTETRVRIVPFTRDENERLRLRQLRALAAALATNAPVALDWLEREHHFTDAARHKEDLRMMYGVLLTNPPPAALVEQLIGYREAKNLTWRLFGMRAEADRFRAALEQGAANERRAKLFLDTLQEIGGELIELARRTKVMDVERTVGDLNTAAFQMRRGTVPRRQASAAEARRLIMELLEQLRQAAPVLAEQEAAARRQLAALPRRAEGDGMLVGREPFLPEWRSLEMEWARWVAANWSEEEQALSREWLAREAAPWTAETPIAKPRAGSRLQEAQESNDQSNSKDAVAVALERAVREPSAENDFALVKAREAAERGAAGEMPAERYPILREWAWSRRALAALRGGRRGAEEFLAEFPEARWSCWSANAGLLTALDTALASGAAEEALRVTRELAARVAPCGAGDRLAGLERGLREILSAGGDAGAASRRVVALGELRRQARALQEEIASALSRARTTALDWRGGPAGIWEAEYRADAERSRQRLEQQVELARQQVLAGIVEGLREKPATEVLANAAAWARWLHRVMRSELCVLGGVRAGPASGGNRGDPHRQFLREELEKARQVRGLKNYAEPTKEYLDAVGDFLRY